MTLLLVGIGGVFGALLRFGIARILSRKQRNPQHAFSAQTTDKGVKDSPTGGCYLPLRRSVQRAMIFQSFPLATFLVNITGAMLLGMLVRLDPGKNAYFLLGDGFLGAFTTFSTLMFEDYTLFREGKLPLALLYLFCSFLLGITGFIAGYALCSL